MNTNTPRTTTKADRERAKRALDDLNHVARALRLIKGTQRTLKAAQKLRAQSLMPAEAYEARRADAAALIARLAVGMLEAACAVGQGDDADRQALAELLAQEATR